MTINGADGTGSAVTVNEAFAPSVIPLTPVTLTTGGGSSSSDTTTDAEPCKVDTV